MQYIHIKNLEKYHPGYKDRKLQWAKVYFSMVGSDPVFEMIESEIDKWRFICFIILELEAQQPIPIDEGYLTKKGFNLKKRKIALTLQVLQKFIETDTEFSKPCNLEEEQEEEQEEELDKEGMLLRNKLLTEVFDYYKQAVGKRLELTKERKGMIDRVLKMGYSVDDCKKAIDNFKNDDWSERSKYFDPSYCFTIRGKIDNFEKWLNTKQEKKKLTYLKED